MEWNTPQPGQRRERLIFIRLPANCADKKTGWLYKVRVLEEYDANNGVWCEYGRISRRIREEEEENAMSTQRDKILAYLQRMQALRAEVTLRQLASDLHYPEASVSAQLRHLRKPCYGGHVIRKRWSSPGCYFYTLDDPITAAAQPVATISLDAQV